MKAVHTDGWSPWVVEPIQRLNAEHEHVAKVENEDQDDNGEDAHQYRYADVTLAGVRGVK